MFLLTMTYFSPSYGAYSGYPNWYQGWGIFLSFLPWLAVAVGILKPSFYDEVMPEEADQINLTALVAKSKGIPVESEEKSIECEPAKDGEVVI